MAKFVVFAGPSLTAADRKRFPSFEFLPPIEQGDMLRAKMQKPAVMVVIDGMFGDRLAVCHKEILECLAEGIVVFGAASMGALRAAELDSFGMHGYGRIYEAYRRGILLSDADVAVAHGPEEFGYPSLSVAMVDVQATLKAMTRRGQISRDFAAETEVAAGRVFYADRTWSAIAEAKEGDVIRANPLAHRLKAAHVEQKRLDAIGVLMHLNNSAPQSVINPFAPPMTPAYEAIRDRHLEPLKRLGASA